MLPGIRPMYPSDLSAVMAIETEANPSPWRTADFEAFLSQPPSPSAGEESIVVAPAGVGAQRMGWVFADPDVRGFLCAQGVADETELQSIAVEKAYWGRGAGSALMQSLFAWAAGMGYADVHLEVREGNGRALGFYTRWGFVETGRRLKYYRDNGETAVLLTRRI